MTPIGTSQTSGAVSDCAYLGVDAGGTQTRAVLRLADGTNREARAGPANWTTLGPARCVEAIAQVIEEAQPPASGLAGACIALAGYYPPWHEREARVALESLLPGVPLRLEPDLVAAWAGATGGRPGIVLVVGTGTVAYGRDSGGRGARAGGWGPLFGDEGGGYWVGCEALRAVARAHDGRGPETALQRLVTAEKAGAASAVPGRFPWSSPSNVSQAVGVEEGLRSVYRDAWDRERIAALSAHVAALAAAGDEAATAILDRAAQALTELVVAVALRLEWQTEPFVMCAVGGVLAAGPPLREPLERRLAVILPRAEWSEPLGPPVEGALLLARGGERT
jgi:N-acetylglucosamine kinase-like BadF-type ATPase